VGLRPFPEPVEFGALVQLDRDHHAVRHTLRTNVAVADVGNVSHVTTDRIVEALLLVVAVEELLPSGADLGLYRGVALAEQFGEELPRLTPRKNSGGRGGGSESGKRDEREGEEGATQAHIEGNRREFGALNQVWANLLRRLASSSPVRKLHSSEIGNSGGRS